MNRRNACAPLLWLGVAGLLLSILGGVYFGPSSAKNLESQLKSDVETALTSQGFDTWAHVEQRGQKVILSGNAPSAEDESKAISSALKASGQGGLLWGGVTKVIDRVEIAPLVSPYTWKAERIGEVVTLSGHAPSRDDLESIMVTATTVFGENVVDNMSLASGAPDSNGWTDMVRLGLGQLEGLDPGIAVFEDENLVLSGSARSIQTVADIETALVSVAHPFVAVSKVKGPYHWAARIDENVLVLEGGVANEAARIGLLETARNAFDGDVVDRMILNERTGWETVAKMCVQHLTRFKSGEVQLVDNTFFFSGEAPESTYGYLTEDMGRLPRPFSAQLDINTISPELPELAGVSFDVIEVQRQDACQEAFMRIMSANRIHFATASDAIDRKSGVTLDKLIVVLRKCSEMNVTVEGHTDDRGDRAFNLDLSEKRAAAVKAYFINRGVPADNLNSIGFGPDQPADTNSTLEGRKNNRRIEFKVAIEEDR